MYDCIRVFTVSTGYITMCSVIPATAPAIMCCINDSSSSSSAQNTCDCPSLSPLVVVLVAVHALVAVVATVVVPVVVARITSALSRYAAAETPAPLLDTPLPSLIAVMQQPYYRRRRRRRAYPQHINTLYNTAPFNASIKRHVKRNQRHRQHAKTTRHTKFRVSARSVSTVISPIFLAPNLFGGKPMYNTLAHLPVI